jgi:hypothetical protein
MKKLRTEVIIKGHGGLNDAFDDVFKAAYNITDDEYDFIAGEATDEELDIVLEALGGLDGSKPTFSLRRQALEIRNKYLKFKKETNGKS